jgi:hypothetical protein
MKNCKGSWGLITLWTLVLAATPLAAQQGGYLKAKVNPGSSTGVFIDGKYVGPAANFGFARKYAVPQGEHEVMLVDPRYEQYSANFTITSGKTTTITQDLKPAPLAKPPFGMLRTQGGNDKFAAVYVNDRYMGHIDEFNNFAQRLLLNPGDYTVKIVSPATGKEHEEKVKIETDKTTTVKVDF